MGSANTAPLVIEFAPGTRVRRERDRVSPLPIYRNGPPGTFVVCPGGLQISLPTDQIVFAEDGDGGARVGFGGMQFSGLAGGDLTFRRVQELWPEDQLSPARSHLMRLDPRQVSTVIAEGTCVWPR